MGGSVSKIMGKIFGTKEMRILMLGLDAAGKTSETPNQDVTTIPTVGFNVESVTYKNVKFNVWDVGGQDKIRPLWRHYYSGTQGLIFVVDSSDTARMEEARSELHKIINDREMKDALLLVFANKQDVQGHMSPEDVTQALQLNKLKDKLWYVAPSVATEGTGIFHSCRLGSPTTSRPNLRNKLFARRPPNPCSRESEAIPMPHLVYSMLHSTYTELVGTSSFHVGFDDRRRSI